MAAQPRNGVSTRIRVGAEVGDELQLDGTIEVPGSQQLLGGSRTLTIQGVQIATWFGEPSGDAAWHVTNPGHVVLVTVHDGSISYQLNHAPVVARHGSLHVLSGDEATTHNIAAPTRLLTAAVPRALLAVDVKQRTAASLGEVTPGPVALVLQSMLAEVFARTRSGAQRAAARTIRNLAIAALDEAVRSPQAEPSTSLHDHIIGYIQRHLADPDLSPRTIASAFDISIRSVHNAFNNDSFSFSGRIREMRLEWIAYQLRAGPPAYRRRLLATEIGFRGQDQLARHFKARYGVTIDNYAARARDTRNRA